jgi:PKD repeat protein
MGQDQVVLQWLAIGGNLPPSADFSVTPPDPETGVEVSFDFGPSDDLDGDVVNYEFDFGVGGGFTDLGSTPAAQHTYAAEGTYPVALRVTDDGGLTDTKALPLEVGNPVHGVIAYLSALPTGGSVPLSVFFDAGASLPGTGEEISEYNFDFNGDGVDDQTGSDPTGSFQFLWPGTYTASVTVVDTAAQSDTASVELELTDDRTWQIVREVAAGKTFSLFEVDGRPALAYENDYGEVVYTRATSATGASWPEPILIDISSDVRGFGDGCTVFGHPAFAYYDKQDGENNLRLNYAFSTTLDGMNDGSWGIELVATCGYISLENSWVSLADLANSPGLLYYTRLPDQLVFRRAHDYTGGTWGDPVVIADEQPSNQPCSLALVDGNPAAAYCRITISIYSGVYYRRSINATGSAWGGETVVLAGDTSNSYGLDGVDLHQYGDLLAIATQRMNSGRLRFCRHDPTNPGTWISQYVNDFGDAAGDYPAWAMLGGYPVMASKRSAGRKVLFRHAGDELGSTWPGEPQVVEDTMSTGHEIGRHTQLVVIGNTPIVAYYDESDQKLCVASLY